MSSAIDVESGNWSGGSATIDASASRRSSGDGGRRFTIA
jgi:hypothetical protein